MIINLIQILEQLKKFVQHENGSRFSLFLYMLGGLIVGDGVLERAIKYGATQAQAYLLAAIVILMFVSIWFISRDIRIKHGRINIGVADLNIIHISDTGQLNFEQKQQLAAESSQYLYTQIQNLLYDGTTVREINLIKIPSRIQVGFENDSHVAQDLGIDILVRGTLKYVGGKYFLDYKLTCSKKIESRAFTQLIQSINSSDDFELDFTKENRELVVFARQLMWISLLLYAIQDMFAGRFLVAQTTFDTVISSMKKLNYKDKKSDIFRLLNYLYHFCSMRNLIMMKDKQINHPMESLTLKSDRIMSTIKSNFGALVNSLKAYYSKSKEDLSANQWFFLEFLYALSSDPYRRRHEDAAFVYQEDDLPNGMKELLSGYFCQIEKNLIDAKLSYHEVLSQDHDNMVAMRSLGLIEYELRCYDLAKQYLENYRSNNTQHIFYRHYIDLRVLLILTYCNLYTWHRFKAAHFYLKYLIARYKNKQIAKKYLIL